MWKTVRKKGRKIQRGKGSIEKDIERKKGERQREETEQFRKTVWKKGRKIERGKGVIEKDRGRKRRNLERSIEREKIEI